MSIWTTLGLERTDDAAEIRRAYARKLKAIDVEADPGAFIALRTAFDQALHHARDGSRDMPALPPIQASSGSGFAPFSPLPDQTQFVLRPESLPPPPAEAAPPPAPPAPPQPAPEPQPAGHRDDGSRFLALETLLFDQGDEIPDPDVLEAAVRDILDHPEMHRVEASADIEHWLATTIYEALPRSDSVLALLVDHFHWDRNTGRLDNPWVFEELAKRRAAFIFVGQVSQPGHRLHRAWQDLTTGKDKLGLGSGWIAKDVRTLLEAIRRDYPMAEHYLSPQRVASWDTRFYADGGSDSYVGHNFGWGGFIIVGVIAFLRIVSASSHSPSPPAFETPPPYVSTVHPATTPQADMNEVILRDTNGRYDFDDMAQRNPALHARLLTRWETQRQAPQPLGAFQGDVDALLRNAERETLRGGSYAVQSAYWSLRRDELVWLRGRDPVACARGADGDWSDANLPASFTERRNEVRAVALGDRLPANAPPSADGTRSYRIPGAAVELAIRQSGLSRERLAAAWMNRGSAQDRCAAQIGLIGAALALPRQEGRQLLRDMSAGL